MEEGLHGPRARQQPSRRQPPRGEHLGGCHPQPAALRLHDLGLQTGRLTDPSNAIKVDVRREVLIARTRQNVLHEPVLAVGS